MTWWYAQQYIWSPRIHPQLKTVPPTHTNPWMSLMCAVHQFWMEVLFLALKHNGCVEPPHHSSAIWEAASALWIQQQVQPGRLNLALWVFKNKLTWEQSSLLAKYQMEILSRVAIVFENLYYSFICFSLECLIWVIFFVSNHLLWMMSTCSTYCQGERPRRAGWNTSGRQEPPPSPGQRDWVSLDLDWALLSIPLSRQRG